MGGCLSSILGETNPIDASPFEKLSPVYANLPEGAQKYMVRNVYDGDTLTLINEERVRFLGIDTPELKEKQPFASEAKQYTYERCHKKEIWISFEPGGQSKDHYGRVLAFVWVKDGSGYLCVNEGIVAAGLAHVYSPKSSPRLKNWQKLVALQKEAREQKRGMWNDFQDSKVFKTPNGAAYHSRSCKHLNSSKNLVELKSSEAMDQGLHPCRSCQA